MNVSPSIHPRKRGLETPYRKACLYATPARTSHLNLDTALDADLYTTYRSHICKRTT